MEPKTEETVVDPPKKKAPTLNKSEEKALDKAAKGIKVERAIVQKTWRRRGRPSGGFTEFPKSCIAALPEVGGPSEVADALHIARASLHQWCLRKKNPLPFITEKDGGKLFRKDIVIKWLKATRRYKTKS